MILTIDLGTSVTKVGLWRADGLVAMGRSSITTARPEAGRVEQDPGQWLASVLTACPPINGPLEAIACTGARESYVPVDEDGRATGPAVMWSDGRRPADGQRCMSPRDFVIHQLTGVAATDHTMASLGPTTGPVLASTEVVGTQQVAGLPRGVPVVVGAGDRQCEVVGTGATVDVAMVSWGTTANVSRPTATDTPAEGLRVTRAAFGGWQLEGGVSAAGSLLAWLHLSLTDAAGSPPGANGVISLPWLGGARAPWWRPTARAAFLNLDAGHTRADIARAALEGVAWDIDRCLRRMPAMSTGLALAGGGAVDPTWTAIVTSMAGVTGHLRRSADAASVGAALLGARAVGLDWSVDTLNPVVGDVAPTHVEEYAARRDGAQRAAEAAMAALDDA